MSKPTKNEPVIGVAREDWLAAFNRLTVGNVTEWLTDTILVCRGLEQTMAENEILRGENANLRAKTRRQSKHIKSLASTLCPP